MWKRKRAEETNNTGPSNELEGINMDAVSTVDKLLLEVETFLNLTTVEGRTMFSSTEVMDHLLDIHLAARALKEELAPVPAMA